MSDAWLTWAKEKYNTDEAGVRRIMAERGQKGASKRRSHNGGFRDKELAREAGKKGRAKREYNKNSEERLDTKGHNDLSGTER